MSNDEIEGPSQVALSFLKALQDRPLYMGTVSAKVKAKRRAANRVARASRRQNRGNR